MVGGLGFRARLQLVMIRTSQHELYSQFITTRMLRGSGGVNIGTGTGDSVGRSIVIHSPTLPEEPICLVMKLEF